mgnify:CR=1 FL=1
MAEIFELVVFLGAGGGYWLNVTFYDDDNVILYVVDITDRSYGIS